MTLHNTLAKLALIWVALTLPVWAQPQSPEEQQAQFLMEATSLSRQLGDKTYTIQKLPDLDTTIRSLEQRAEEINRRGDIVSRKGDELSDLGDKIARDAENGQFNFEDFSTLMKGTAGVTREAAELGAEGAALGAEGALLGVEASRLGITAAEIGSYATFGLPSSALAQYELRDTDKASTTLQLARMRAAQESGQSDLAYTYSQKVVPENHLERYISLSSQSEARPSPGVEAHIKARRQALRELSAVVYSPKIDAQQWAWARDCQEYWLRTGSLYDELGVQDLAESELNQWSELHAASNGQSVELMFCFPELALLQAELLGTVGDVSGARTWVQAAEDAVADADSRLQSFASRWSSKYPGLKVSDSPRLFLLKGYLAEVQGRLELTEGRSPASRYSVAHTQYKAAQDPIAEIELLIDWPNLDSNRNERLSSLSKTHQHQRGQIVAKINQAYLLYEADQKDRALGILQPLFPEIRNRASEYGIPTEDRFHFDRAYALQARLEAERGNASAALTSLNEKKKLQTSSSLSSGAQSSNAGSGVRQKQSRMRALEEEQSAESTLPAEASRPADSGSLIASNKKEFVTKARELRETNPSYASLLFVDPVEFSKLQAKIPPKTVILQYFPSEDGVLYIFAVSPTDYAIRTVEIDSKELTRLVRRYRSIVSRFPPPPIAWEDDGTKSHDYAKVFYRLHQLLIEPVEKEISGFETVAVIPTGHLHYLPFSSLARPTDKGPEFLIQRKQVVVLTKASDLALLDDKAKTVTKLIALGNPDGTLPGAAAEVEDLERVFPSSQILMGSDATKSRLRTASPSAGYLHLATHGVLNNRDPNASFITLAGNEELGRLHPPEIFDLPLSGTRLVTMSACSTALGRANPGAEVTSLAEAFWVAGAPSVVASLWKVADDSTRVLMVDFYGELKEGQSLAASMQTAQLKQLEGEYAHPFYWAPFVLLGDWR